MYIILPWQQKERMAGVLTTSSSLEEEQEPVNIVLPRPPEHEYESLESDDSMIVPPPPSPTLGMRKLSFNVPPDENDKKITNFKSEGKNCQNDENRSCDLHSSSQPLFKHNDVSPFNMHQTKADESSTGGENSQVYFRSSTCER